MSPLNSSPLTYTIRAAKNADLKFLTTIEASAASLFRSDLTLAPLADDEPMSVSQHEDYLQKWQATQLDLGIDTGTWVAVALHEHKDSSAGEIVGFIVTQPLQVEWDGLEFESKQYFVHIKELSVCADHQRQGLASKLIGRVRGFVKGLRKSEFVGLSLTTFRDVPYNGPFYARLGFRELRDRDGVNEAVGIRGVNIWDDEQAHFADVGDGSLRKRRCWMIADA